MIDIIKNKLLITILCVLSYSLCNLSGFAIESEGKLIKGTIAKNHSAEPEMVIFLPEDVELEITEKNEINLSEGYELKELKISEIDEINTKKRLTKAASFMFLGGLSVTGSIERSLRDGKASGKLIDNFKNPISSARKGWKADDNEFLINYVGHPLEWFLLANYLKAAGATDKEAILISQLVNLSWEFVVEGCYIAPSPKDLATNTLGSLAGIYLYNKVLNKPINATYIKFSSFGQKHGVDLLPQVKYNSNSKGMMFGAVLRIKK